MSSNTAEEGFGAGRANLPRPFLTSNTPSISPAYLDQWVMAGCGGVRPWTLKGYTSVVNRHIKPRIGQVPLQKLTPAEVKAFYADVRANGNSRSNGSLLEKSVHNIHICLRAGPPIRPILGLRRGRFDNRKDTSPMDDP